MQNLSKEDSYEFQRHMFRQNWIYRKPSSSKTKSIVYDDFKMAKRKGYAYEESSFDIQAILLRNGIHVESK